MLQINHLTIVHRKDLRTILEDFSLVLNRGDKAVLVGEEGNGKSTLLRWIYDPASIEEYAEARGTRASQGELVAYLPQELAEEEKEKSVAEYFAAAGRAESEWGPEADWTAGRAAAAASPAALARIANQLRLDNKLFSSAQRMGSLSGGERVKVQMARILLGEPDYLLLDEPSNDIDIETLEWLERLINSFPGGVLYISHDETLIERTANRVVLLEQLRRKSLPRWTVANVDFRTFMDERRAALDKQERDALSERREERKAMERFRKIEQKVLQDQANVSRQDPHSGRLLKKKTKAVKSLERRYEREHEEMTERPEEEAPITIKFERQKAMPAGKTVLELDLPELLAPAGPDAAGQAGAARPLATNLHLRVRGPEKICIIGSNGAGKTTLIRKIADELLARSDLAAFYMPQNYEDVLPFDATPVDYLAPSGHKDDITQVRTYLGSMKYTADEMYHPIRELSGGQKAKLLLLKISITEADVLILDEPTRNLSPLSAPEIRAILRAFPGAIIADSHDRKFIQEVCPKVYTLGANGLALRE
jgi:ATPase subunit of ABC transporter with duplicated ATPase domains